MCYISLLCKCGLNFCVQNKSVGNQALPSGRYPMCVAADYGQTDVIRYLIDNGADVNVSAHFHTVDYLFRTPADAVCLVLDIR